METYETFTDGEQKEQEGKPHQPVIIVGEPERDKRQSNSLSVCSLVLGILSVVFCWIPYAAVIIGIVAAVQGIMVLAQHRPGKGMAVAGIITGILGFLIALLLGILILIGLMLYSA